MTTIEINADMLREIIRQSIDDITSDDSIYVGTLLGVGNGVQISVVVTTAERDFIPERAVVAAHGPLAVTLPTIEIDIEKLRAIIGQELDDIAGGECIGGEVLLGVGNGFQIILGVTSDERDFLPVHHPLAVTLS